MIATPRLVMDIKTGEIQTIQALAVTNSVGISPFKQRNDSSGSHLKTCQASKKRKRDANRDTSFGLCRASEISKHLGYLNQVAAAQEMS